MCTTCIYHWLGKYWKFWLKEGARKDVLVLLMKNLCLSYLETNVLVFSESFFSEKLRIVQKNLNTSQQFPYFKIISSLKKFWNFKIYFSSQRSTKLVYRNGELCLILLSHIHFSFEKV